MSDDIKILDIAEFRRLGILQEVNRQFFHPLGLALAVLVDDESGEERLGAIWDYRDDPEGMAFADGTIDPVKVSLVAAERAKHATARRALFGDTVQPV